MPRGIPNKRTTQAEVSEVEAPSTVEQEFSTLVGSEAPASETKGPVPTRRKRGVFNGTTGKLQVHGTIPGYHLHIMNDDRNRLQEAQDNGYEFVTPKEIEGVSENVTSRNGDLGGSRVRFLVGSTERGEPMYGYLMKLRQEWFDEDQKELQAKNDKIDEAIRAGSIVPNPAFYTPKGGIKLST